MCRNIRVLHGFEPPTTVDEIRAAAQQFVRKVSGIQKPSHVDEKTFDRAIEEVARSTERLLAHLAPRKEPRTREGELDKARAKWAAREKRMRG